MSRAEASGGDGRTVRALLGGGSKQIGAALVGLVTFPLLTRLLDTETLGAWMIIGQASFFIALADLGLTTSVQRAAVGEDPGLSHRTLSLALLVCAVLLPFLALGAFGIVTAMVGTSGPLGRSVLTAAPVALLGGVAGGLAAPIRGFVVARGNADAIALARVIAQVVFLLLLVGGFALDGGLLAPACALLGSQLVELAVLARSARLLDPTVPLRPRWSCRPGEALRAFRDGAAGFCINLTTTLQTGIDVFVLGAFGMLQAVAGYRIGLRAPELSYLLARQATRPLLRDLGRPEHRARAVRVGTGIFSGAVVSVMAALAFVGQPLLVLWLGDKASGEIPALVLTLMSLSLMTASLFEVVGIMVMMGARTAWAGAGPVLVGTAVNLVVSLAGVRVWGVWAVAGSTLLGYAVTAALVWWQACRMTGWGTRAVARMVAAPFAAGATAIPLSALLSGYAQGGAAASLLSCVLVTGSGLAATAAVTRSRGLQGAGGSGSGEGSRGSGAESVPVGSPSGAPSPPLDSVSEASSAPSSSGRGSSERKPMAGSPVISLTCAAMLQSAAPGESTRGETRGAGGAPFTAMRTGMRTPSGSVRRLRSF